tara:strand:- start:569 stop:823 length:255 start_codon:yes stop_codon:yes gene_type:complete
MLKKLINKVMFKYNKINIKDQKKEEAKQEKELLNIPKDQISLSLSQDEIAILLQSIKNSNFSGSVLDVLYNLVHKLQTGYNKIK